MTSRDEPVSTRRRDTPLFRPRILCDSSKQCPVSKLSLTEGVLMKLQSIELYCPKYTVIRKGTLSTLHNSHTNIDALLRGNSNLQHEVKEIIFVTVHEFINQTCRFYLKCHYCCVTVAHLLRPYMENDNNSCATQKNVLPSLFSLASLLHFVFIFFFAVVCVLMTNVTCFYC